MIRTRKRPAMLAAALLALLLAVGPAQQGARAQDGGASVVTAPGAVLRALDKIAGTSRDIELAAGESVNFGRLTITLSECRSPADDPAADAYAHLVIRDAHQLAPVFRGWMIASSPALNALDHARFDVWVIRCTSS